MADELQKLQALHDAGTLSEEEFRQAKEQLLAHRPEAWRPDLEREARQWGLFLHLSQFAGFVVPIAGLIAPIILWQVKKDELPGIDAHGKVVLNWILSELIYALVCIPLAFILIGIPMLLAVMVLAIVFPIVGGLKANEGTVWPYPLSIPFFK
jgi:uncharacterized Tic20 family protein